MVGSFAILSGSADAKPDNCVYEDQTSNGAPGDDAWHERWYCLGADYGDKFCLASEGNQGNTPDGDPYHEDHRSYCFEYLFGEEPSVYQTNNHEGQGIGCDETSKTEGGDWYYEANCLLYKEPGMVCALYEERHQSTVENGERQEETETDGFCVDFIYRVT